MRKVEPAENGKPCTSCGLLVLWTKWPNGKWMPVDKHPTPTGNLVLKLSKTKNMLYVDKFDAKLHVGRNRFTSHFATCPRANQHRRR